MGVFADWEYEDFSVGSTCSGLSDVISLQSSDGGSPNASDHPPRLESLQSFTSAMSPGPAVGWGSTDRLQQGKRAFIDADFAADPDAAPVTESDWL